MLSACAYVQVRACMLHINVVRACSKMHVRAGACVRTHCMNVV